MDKETNTVSDKTNMLLNFTSFFLNFPGVWSGLGIHSSLLLLGEGTGEEGLSVRVP